MPDSGNPSEGLLLPDVPAIVAGRAFAARVSAAGEAEIMALEDAAAAFISSPHLICHAAHTARMLGCSPSPCLDILELYLFVRPTQFCLPTPRGLARALALEPPADLENEAAFLHRAARSLLEDVAAPTYPDRTDAARTAFAMSRLGWTWGKAVVQALGGPPEMAGGPLGGLDVWNRLSEWEERAPPTPPEGRAVSRDRALERLKSLLGPDEDIRFEQARYVDVAVRAFAPRENAGVPNVVLAEAGTGVGKTVAYIAPASVWAETNKGTVWLSTYTRNLQRQLDQELTRLYPDPSEKAEKAVVRKGRENYLCLLNLEETIARGAPGRAAARRAALGLIARWARYSRDGDMTGGDFPSWASYMFGAGMTGALTDHRGECVYSSCTHYRKCFIERAVRKSRRARVVIANHALVMVQAAISQTPGHRHGDEEANNAPERVPYYVFDEGHHLFQAADNAFSSHLCAVEAAELRRWVRGAESVRRRPGAGRARGLEERLGGLAEGTDAEEALHEALRAAACLPGDGWWRRLNDGSPLGDAESFLDQVRRRVYAGVTRPDTPYSLEVGTNDLPQDFLEAAMTLAESLERLRQPLIRLSNALARRLDDDAESLDTSERIRLEAASRGLDRRALLVLPAWISMLQALHSETPAEFVDWLSVDRAAGRDVDVGLHRHWVDPTVPFAEYVLTPSHGALITSATLRDRGPPRNGETDAVSEDEQSWQTAEMRTGISHLVEPAVRSGIESPFDYAARTKVFVVNDVDRNRSRDVAAAFRQLFLAADGGALGLFTAINRLRAVYDLIAEPLERADITLHSQHVDAIDPGTLVDLFRAEPRSCLLGTDAVRDGIDVPGDSLRLIVFDRVPWPRPDILHRARREAFGGTAYDDMITRFRLKQAFGRLMRRAEDRGVFIMLDSRTPSRLATAFPSEVGIERLGLADAIASTRQFLQQDFET